MINVGVEKGLTNVINYLTEEGYAVVPLGASIDENVAKLNDLDAIVTAGYNTDMMGISDTETKAPVINAKGLTPQEIKSHLENRIHDDEVNTFE